MIWVEFSITAVLVIIFGYKLSEKADRLAEIKGFGKGLVGFILLGFSTSLPELISTVSSTLFLDNPELGAGNIIGSNNANLFILAVSLLLTVSLRKKNNMPDSESLISLSFCFLTASVFSAAVLFEGRPLIGRISSYSFIMLVLFFLSIAALTSNGNADDSEEKKEKGHAGPLFYSVLVFYILVLVAVSYYLAGVVDRISSLTGLSAGTAGAVFLAWATSLPELVVTVSAIIIGSSEMGIGNILGSNIFNFGILSIADFLSKSGKSLYNAGAEIPVLTAVHFFMLSILLYMVSAKKLPCAGRVSVLPVLISSVYIGGLLFIL